jgi:hypothetical protein
MRKKTKIVVSSTGAALIIAIAVLSFYIHDMDWFGSGISANTPQEMFECIIEDPIPSYVANLEGGGYTWQGYAIWLRFNASDRFIDKLRQQGYEVVDWEAISHQFEIASEIENRFSSWDPGEIKDKICFQKDVSNSWTHVGTHYFVYDRENKVIYFSGTGA